MPTAGGRRTENLGSFLQRLNFKLEEKELAKNFNATPKARKASTLNTNPLQASPLTPNASTGPLAPEHQVATPKTPGSPEETRAAFKAAVQAKANFRPDAQPFVPGSFRQTEVAMSPAPKFNLPVENLAQTLRSSSLNATMPASTGQTPVPSNSGRQAAKAVNQSTAALMAKQDAVSQRILQLRRERKKDGVRASEHPKEAIDLARQMVRSREYGWIADAENPQMRTEIMSEVDRLETPGSSQVADDESTEKGNRKENAGPSVTANQKALEKEQAAQLHALALQAQALDERRKREELAHLEAEKERQKAKRLEADRLEAERREAERLEAERREQERQEAARREAERREQERQEAERRRIEEENARIEAERVKAEQEEAARQEAARKEAARKEAALKEHARQEAARKEAARKEAALKQQAQRQAAFHEAMEHLSAEEEKQLLAVHAQQEEIREKVFALGELIADSAKKVNATETELAAAAKTVKRLEEELAELEELREDRQCQFDVCTNELTKLGEQGERISEKFASSYAKLEESLHEGLDAGAGEDINAAASSLSMAAQPSESTELAPSNQNKSSHLGTVEERENVEVGEDRLQFAAWPNARARPTFGNPNRNVKLVNLPVASTYNSILKLVWGGRIEKIEYTYGGTQAHVLFMRGEDCQKYYLDTSNGIEYPGEPTRTVWVEMGDPIPVSEMVRGFYDSNFTRCVRAVGIDEDWTTPTLTRVAVGKGRKVENVLVGSNQNGLRIVEFRFTSVAEASRFKMQLDNDMEWEHCTIFHTPDPCEQATGVRNDVD